MTPRIKWFWTTILVLCLSFTFIFVFRDAFEEVDRHWELVVWYMVFQPATLISVCAYFYASGREAERKKHSES